MLFHFCHFSEVIYRDLKRTVTSDVCINQRTHNYLGGTGWLVSPLSQSECPRSSSYHLSWA